MKPPSAGLLLTSRVESNSAGTPRESRPTLSGGQVASPAQPVDNPLGASEPEAGAAIADSRSLAAVTDLDPVVVNAPGPVGHLRRWSSTIQTITSTSPVPEPTNPVRAVELDADAHARELERRAAAAIDPCERERLLYLSHFARSRPVLPVVTPLDVATGDQKINEKGRQP